MKIPVGLKKVAVLCLLECNKSFLLLKRNKEPNKYLFTPIGGKLEPFESPLQAATRETKEEAGVDVTEWTYCGTLTETSPTKYNWINYVYHAKVEYFPEPHCDEGILEWMLFENITNIPTPTTDWFIYKYVRNGQKFAFNAIFNENLKLLGMKDDLENEVVYPKKR